MNEEIEEKIEKLANNLKNMHLVSTIEEARERAKEIILSTTKEGDKSIKEMMDETKAKQPLPKIEEIEKTEENKDEEENTEELKTEGTSPERDEND